jgi:hypothetical protein
MECTRTALASVGTLAIKSKSNHLGKPRIIHPGVE